LTVAVIAAEPLTLIIAAVPESAADRHRAENEQARTELKTDSGFGYKKPSKSGFLAL
jgi:hypothetical protein